MSDNLFDFSDDSTLEDFTISSQSSLPSSPPRPLNDDDFYPATPCHICRKFTLQAVCQECVVAFVQEPRPLPLPVRKCQTCPLPIKGENKQCPKCLLQRQAEEIKLAVSSQNGPLTWHRFFASDRVVFKRTGMISLTVLDDLYRDFCTESKLPYLPLSNKELIELLRTYQDSSFRIKKTQSWMLTGVARNCPRPTKRKAEKQLVKKPSFSSTQFRTIRQLFPFLIDQAKSGSLDPNKLEELQKSLAPKSFIVK